MAGKKKKKKNQKNIRLAKGFAHFFLKPSWNLCWAKKKETDLQAQVSK